MSDKKFKNQSEMFNWIYENKEWVSEIDGSPLPYKGHYQWHWCFAHKLSKGSYPSEKLNPENIMLLTPDQHQNQEQYPQFIQSREEMKQIYYSKLKKYE
jgi:hypothetical protein